MNKSINLKVIVLILVILMGSIPALVTIFNNTEGRPFQRPDGLYWKAFIVAIISIFFVVLVSYYLCRRLFRSWYKETKNEYPKPIIVGTIVLITGVISVVVGVEFICWTMLIFGWGFGENFFNWSMTLIALPLMTILYCFLPVLIISIISAIFSVFYLKSSK
jgi:Kef-type K+ transport system membrane component KefB